jgi:hypothetical protein
MFEILIVSVVYWGGILVGFLWVSKKISLLKKRLAALKDNGS